MENGFLHGDQVTVNGKTMAENLSEVPRLSELAKQVIVCKMLCVSCASSLMGKSNTRVERQYKMADPGKT